MSFSCVDISLFYSKKMLFILKCLIALCSLQRILRTVVFLNPDIKYEKGIFYWITVNR